MAEFLQDVRYALRLLRKNPGFAAVAALTVALGVGANTAIFSVVNGVLLKPLPYREPERLVRVFESHRVFPTFPLSPGNFLDYRERNHVFEGVALYARRDRELSEGDRPERLAGMGVSSGFFAVLGFQPALGRDFLREEELTGKGNVAVLSHGLWRRRFGSDPQIVDKSVTLSGMPFLVVGVMPAGVLHVGGEYRSLPHGENVDIWTPLTLEPGKMPRGAHYLNAVARLKAGVSREQASAEMNAIAAQLEQQYPRPNRGWRIRLMGLREQIVGRVQTMLLVLLGAVGLVLLIACVNVANLLLARATARQREIAVRAALGAGRMRLLRQLLTESLVIAAAGGALGLLLAGAGVPAFLALSPENLPRLESVRIDGRILAFTLACTILTAVLFGLAPALQASRAELSEALKAAASQRLRARASRLLVVGEVSLAFLLSIGAGLLLRSFLSLQRVNPGFQPDGVVTMSLDLPAARYKNPQAIAQFYQRLAEKARALPGVRAAGATSDVPWTGYDENTSFDIEGRVVQEAEGPHARFHVVTPDYFRAIGTPLLAGRPLDERDTAEAPTVILINQAMARRYWPGEDPIGRRLRLWGRQTTIAGVVGDVKDTPAAAAAEPAFYWPHAQQPSNQMTLAVRADSDPWAMVEVVRREVLALDKDLPIADVKTLDQVVEASVSAPRFSMLLVGVFAAAALALASVGIYGVLSYSVSQRVQEIGVRMALGASRRDVLAMVLGDGLKLMGIGIGIGLAAAFALTRVLKTLLYGVSATDPATFVVVSALAAVVGLLACYIPARRALRVDPMVALRYE